MADCKVNSVTFNQTKSDLQTAQEKVRESKNAYMSCLLDKDRGAYSAIAMTEAKPDMDRMAAEARTIDTMSQFILKQLGRESGTNNSIGVLSNLAKETSAKLETEIDELKSSIRLERRRFLDASPSVSPAVGGLYFTQEPDNRTIIIFRACFGSFLLVTGLLILYGAVPVDLYGNTTFGQRLTVVVSGWIAALLLTYVGFFTFT
jgi:hypothetical protein